MSGGTCRLKLPLNRFFIWFIAQLERPVMHWKHKLRACLIGHRKRLFRSAACTNPGVVGPNGHDGQVYRLRGPDLAKHIGISRVAPEQDTMASSFDEISVISPMNVGARPRAPMVHFDR